MAARHTSHGQRADRRCVRCGAQAAELIPLTSALPELVSWIAEMVPAGLSPGDRICTSCLNRERIAHTIQQLEQERGELTAIEAQIALHETNLKAELEIASMHDKIDHLLHSQWEQLVEMQQVQLDLLQQIAEKTKQRSS